MMTRASALVLLFSIFLFAGISAHAYRPINDDQLKELVQSFNYVANVELVRTGAPGCTGQDVEFNTTYPQRDSKLSIQGKTYIPTGNAEPVPVVFMLPPLGGANQLDVLMAQTFCKNNVAAIILTTNLTGLDGPSLVAVTDHDHTHRRVAAALKGAMVLARTFNEINPEKMGLFGASLGGILGSVAYSVLPEISAGTFLVNGGDVPNILANSDQGVVVKLKNQRMAEQHFTTTEEYERYLNENLKIDPMHFTRFIQSDTIKLFLSKADKSVPSADQMLYYNALGQPKETKFYMIGHAETIVAVLAIGQGKQQIVDWFKSRFAQRNPRLGPNIWDAVKFRF